MHQINDLEVEVTMLRSELNASKPNEAGKVEDISGQIRDSVDGIGTAGVVEKERIAKQSVVEEVMTARSSELLMSDFCLSDNDELQSLSNESRNLKEQLDNLLVLFSEGSLQAA